MKTSEFILVFFRKNNPPYLAGEQAGFDPAYAAKLVEEGRAEYLEPPPGLDIEGNPLPVDEPEPKAKPNSPTRRKAKAK